jgi:hypothetical protein
MLSGVDTVDIANASNNPSNNPTITNLSKSDSIGIGQVYSTAPTFIPLSLGGTTGVVNFNNAGPDVNFYVTLASATNNTFYAGVSENVIDGATYYVATLDPPVSKTGSTGATGARGPTGAIGPTDPNKGHWHHHDNGHGSIGSQSLDLPGFAFLGGLEDNGHDKSGHPGSDELGIGNALTLSTMETQELMALLQRTNLAPEITLLLKDLVHMANPNDNKDVKVFGGSGQHDTSNIFGAGPADTLKNKGHSNSSH